jgi:hypothetical protein
MENKVILIARQDCHWCEVLLYELLQVYKIDPLIIFDTQTPELFNDFTKHFGIKRYPVIQIDNGTEFITIHQDIEYFNNNKTSPNYIFVKDLNEMIDKALYLLK